MNQHRIANDSADDAQKATLRDRVLAHGRRLGWSAHAVIAFTEQLTRHPWKRCSCAELATVLDEYRRLLGVDALARHDVKISHIGLGKREPERRCRDVAHD